MTLCSCGWLREVLVSDVLVQAVEPDEYAGRLRRVRAAMAARDFGALVVTDPANLFYLTGYDAWSFYTPQCLVVPADGEPHLFARAMDAAGAGFTCNLRAEQIHGYPEDLVHRPDLHPFDWIAITARELIPPTADVGIEGDSHFFSARAYLALAAGLPSNRLVDSAELVNWVRLVKSPHELGQLRIAGRIATQAMRIALDQLQPGRRQCDLVAEILAAQAIGTPEHGGDYPAIVPLLPTGDAAGTPHLTWTDRLFKPGEATTIELAGVFGRYHAPLARTVMLGDPPQRLGNAAKVVAESMQAALGAIRPGVRGSAVHSAFNAVIAAHGMVKESRIGYSIGIGYPPDWGERTVSLRPGENTELAAGMAFHVILGMWMDGWGYELSEPVVVTPTGVERLTDLPQELTIRR
jgi:ectoine hydrolase